MGSHVWGGCGHPVAGGGLRIHVRVSHGAGRRLSAPFHMLLGTGRRNQWVALRNQFGGDNTSLL